ncbi:hypothetical protein [Marinobacter nauticus]|uniref:hypothetical protein n=1 Tax=Marinobacter nauticus TaxID=2743 RepID=UPI001C95A733|nr:hypothetical protein [Marinobacter nauticus]MBY6104709.1 hypothetical protein [Marinobacter nauticus]
MREEYQSQYRAEVESLAEKGFELYFLSGESLRAKVGKLNEGMPTELAGQISAICRSSLALGEFGAETLAERFGDSAQNDLQSLRAKHTSKVN